MRGDGRIFKRGNIYWCAYSLRGKEYRESCETSDEQTAKKFLQAKMREVGADVIGAKVFVTPRAAKLTVGELIAALRADFELRGILSAQNICHLARAEKDFGMFRAARLTAEQVDAIVSKRLADGDRPATVNRELACVKQSYGLAIRRGTLNRMPFIRRMDERDGIRKEFFSESEIAAVIENLPDDLRDFTRWCAAVGMRKGEASELRWNMVRGDELHIPGDICKNRQPRTLPLSGVLAEIIERRRQAARIEVNGAAEMVPFIFHRSGRAVEDFTKSWAAATEKAGCPGKLFHSLRRSAVRRMVRAGVSTQVAKKWSGHTSDAVFQRYAILDTNDMRDAFATAEKFRETDEKKVVSIGGRP